MTTPPKETMIHELKCWPEYFQAILDGSKTFEVRERDRPFKVGDTLRLREYIPPSGAPDDGGDITGREINVTVTYLLGTPSPFAFPGFAVMGIRKHAPPPTEAEVSPGVPLDFYEQNAELLHSLAVYCGMQPDEEGNHTCADYASVIRVVIDALRARIAAIREGKS